MIKALLERLRRVETASPTMCKVHLKNGETVRTEAANAVDYVYKGLAVSVDFESEKGQGMLPALLNALCEGESGQ